LKKGWSEHHPTPIKLLMIDNYDSFTYNIVQYFGELGAEVEVFRNDEITVEGIAAAQSRSPGGLARALFAPMRRVSRWRPFSTSWASCRFWACAWATRASVRRWAASIVRAQQLMHGKTSVITTTQEGVFAGLPKQFTVNRYHSLAIERATCPKELAITAWTDDGEIMGVRHRPGRRAHGRRAVSPGVDTDRARPRDAEEFLEISAKRRLPITTIASPYAYLTEG
jgi:anthranilate synthase component 2